MLVLSTYGTEQNSVTGATLAFIYQIPGDSQRGLPILPRLDRLDPLGSTFVLLTREQNRAPLVV